MGDCVTRFARTGEENRATSKVFSSFNASARGSGEEGLSSSWNGREGDRNMSVMVKEAAKDKIPLVLC